MPMSQFCVEDGCHEVTVGVGRWEGRGPVRNPHPRREAIRCRAHLVASIEDELVRCQVVGEHKIVDFRTGASVGKPGLVELDPAETNIAALVSERLVKVLPSTPAAEPAGED